VPIWQTVVENIFATGADAASQFKTTYGPCTPAATILKIMLGSSTTELAANRYRVSEAGHLEVDPAPLFGDLFSNA
jgi:hypothetical protein